MVKLVNVQNQVLSNIAIARKARKRQSISKQFKMGVLFCFVFCFFWFSVKRNYAEIYKSTDNPTDGVYTIKPDNLPAFWWCILWPNDSRWRVDCVLEKTERLGWFFPLLKRLQIWLWRPEKGILFGTGQDSPPDLTTCCVWSWKTLKGTQPIPSITCLVIWGRKTWSMVLIQVELSFRLFYSSHYKKGEGRGGEGKRVLSNVNMIKLFNIIQ